MTHVRLTRVGPVALAMLLSACASTTIPNNRGDLREPTSVYMSEWKSSFRAGLLPTGFAQNRNAERCTVSMLPEAIEAVPVALDRARLSQPILAPGDVLEITVEDDALFSGPVIISNSGSLKLRALPAVQASGISSEALSVDIAKALEDGQFYRQGYATVSARVKVWAPVDVFVEGAVFNEGRVTVNDLPADAVHADQRSIAGDLAKPRTVSAALRGAAGVRPDADLSRVALVRDGQRHMLDLSGLVSGAETLDPFVEANDKIVVPTRECFEKKLARPSAVTAPGIRIFLSNLTVPARANAPSAVGRDAQSVPYGTTMSQALFSANCVGGTQITNAGRFALLATTNPLTDEQVVITRPIESLMRREDRREFNPVLLPGDAIACYDSVVTNVRDVMSMFGEVIGPGILAASVLEASQ